jgi:hypothetical protein
MLARGFWHRVASIGLIMASTSALAQEAAGVQRIETTSAILSFKAGSGDLVGLQWKHPKLELIAEPKLGENFRILLPKPDYEANYFDSRDQVLRKLERSADDVVLHYGPLKNVREQVDVRVDYEIRDTGTQLQFSIRVDNATDRMLAEVFYAIVGGQQGIERRLDTESLIPGVPFIGMPANLAPRLFSQYEYSGLNIGGRFDFNGYGYPGVMPMGWMEVYNPKAGVGYYYANQDPETRVTTLYTEVRPFTKTLIIANQDNWPKPEELPRGEPIGLTMGWVNFPYTARGPFRAGPIALQVHEGDWRRGATLYRSWFDQHFKVARSPNWLQREMAWQAIIMQQPEDSIFFRFNDLKRLAMDAKRYGVTTIEIEGWSVGGNDRGYPNFRPDPRLGTVVEFRKALADMRAVGVHALLMVDTQVVDTSTEAFRARLSRYAVEGRWAPDRQIMGFGEGTIGARAMDATTSVALSRSLALVSPSHAEFREELLRQYLQLIQEGAEGLQADKYVLGNLDFNPAIPTSPDKSLPDGTLQTFQDYLSRARTINPNVALAAGTGNFDRAYPYVDVWRNMLPGKDPGPMAVLYAFPEWTATALAITPGDIDALNNGLRYGMVWLVCERLYGSMDEPLYQPFSRYLAELIRVRKQHSDLLFHARFYDTTGATVSADQADVRYSVFGPMDTNSSKRAVIVVNFGDREQSADVDIAGSRGAHVTISAPFAADRVAVLPVKLSVPPHRVMVVVAQ